MSDEQQIIDESFKSFGKSLQRTITIGPHSATTKIELSKKLPGKASDDPAKLWALEYLRGAKSKLVSNQALGWKIRVLDLFCGVGGLALGFSEAARSLGSDMEIIGCADLDKVALSVYRHNLRPRHVFPKAVDSLVDYQITYVGDVPRFAYPPEIIDEKLSQLVGKVDVVIGGPPCQGYSNFNNRTRRKNTYSNSLYLTVPAIAVALGAGAIVIENVEMVRQDEGDVVGTSCSVLENPICDQPKYQVEELLLHAEEFNVPQTRTRHFLVASKNMQFDFPAFKRGLAKSQSNISAREAIRDLVKQEGKDAFNRKAALSEENQKRIDWLFENDKDNLENHMRPDCHKDGHTYPSVYGRIMRDRPAQTITTGFLSPGRGRFIHPTEKRGLTPHEGARLQGFPDSYEFSDGGTLELTNGNFSKLIGDAVPPPLGRAVGLFTLASLGDGLFTN